MGLILTFDLVRDNKERLAAINRQLSEMLFDSAESLAYHDIEAALDGELAVPCTRNPL